MRHEIRFSKTVEEQVYADADNYDFYSNRVEFLVSAASAVFNRSCPSLTVNEWCAMVDVLNCPYDDFDTADIESILSHSWFQISESSYECDDKWAISCNSLAKRLLELPFPEQLSAYNIVSKFWAKKKGDGRSFKEIFTSLGAPGLV